MGQVPKHPWNIDHTGDCVIVEQSTGDERLDALSFRGPIEQQPSSPRGQALCVNCYSFSFLHLRWCGRLEEELDRVGCAKDFSFCPFLPRRPFLFEIQGTG